MQISLELMFIRVKTTPNSPCKSVQVVENKRDPKTGLVKQKIIRYVGIAIDDSEEAKLKSMGLEWIARVKLELEENSVQMSLLPSLSATAIMEAIATAKTKKPGRRLRKKIEDILPTTCLVPLSSGIVYTELKKDNLWDKYYTNAPRLRTELELKYSNLKKASLY